MLLGKPPEQIIQEIQEYQPYRIPENEQTIIEYCIQLKMRKLHNRFHHLTNHFPCFSARNRTFLTRETYGSGSRNIRFPREKHKKFRHTFSLIPVRF